MSTSSPRTTSSVSVGTRLSTRPAKLSATKEAVQAKIGQAKRRLDEGRETVHDKADEVTRQTKSLANQAREQIPTPVAGRLNRLTRAVRQRPVPAVAMVLTVFVSLLLRRLLRRNEG